MKLYAPKYYKRFKCIADRCRHSCCIGWEIDIDGATLERYSSLGEGYGKSICESIEKGEYPHFRLCGDERCPHLDDKGLCRIITELGEGYLCNICREHPRFYNGIPDGTEAGLGLSCEEAARLILSSDGYDLIEVIGETEGEADTAFDPRPIRRMLYDVLSDRTVSYEQRLSSVCERLWVSPSVLSDGEWRELISSLEYLDPSHKELFLSYTSDASTPRELWESLERALAYFIYRHVSAAKNEYEARAALGFALFCERLICSVSRADPSLSVYEAARIVSEELEYSEDNTEALKLEFMF